MEYYYEFQDWLYQTSLYQDILKELPVPLNNLHFDSVVIIGVGGYVVYRVVDGVCYGIYRRHIHRKQEKERKLQWEREKEMISRELQVQQKEENLGRFWEYLERVSVRGRGRGSGSAAQNISGQRQGWVGRKDLRLEMNDSVGLGGRAGEGFTEYDTVMDAFAFDEEQSLEINQKRYAEKEQVYNRMNELDDALRVREIDDGAKVIVDWVEDPTIEKRKERARKKAEKEHQRAEKKRIKEEKRQEKLQKSLQKKLNGGIKQQRMQDKLQKWEADGRNSK
ncbi:MAG: hypothetical protein IKB01_14780 [Lachnospiraceae bacterium]|nr:hypothetical protein [Lachnospiraceae bacterium]